jgi:hypothetical protein
MNVGIVGLMTRNSFSGNIYKWDFRCSVQSTVFNFQSTVRMLMFAEIFLLLA